MERVLLADLYVPRLFKHLETRCTKWWKLDWPMTAGQAPLAVAGATILPMLALLLLSISLRTDPHAAIRMMMERPLATIILNLGHIIITFALMTACGRFVVAMAGLTSPSRLAMASHAVAIAILPVISVSLTVGCVNARFISAAVLLWSILAGIGLIFGEMLVGYLIATLRKPYVEWLTLNIAG
jgi:hypothetical protein